MLLGEGPSFSRIIHVYWLQISHANKCLNNKVTEIVFELEIQKLTANIRPKSDAGRRLSGPNLISEGRPFSSA